MTTSNGIGTGLNLGAANASSKATNHLTNKDAVQVGNDDWAEELVAGLATLANLPTSPQKVAVAGVVVTPPATAEVTDFADNADPGQHGGQGMGASGSDLDAGSDDNRGHAADVLGGRAAVDADGRGREDSDVDDIRPAAKIASRAGDAEADASLGADAGQDNGMTSKIEYSAYRKSAHRAGTDVAAPRTEPATDESGSGAQTAHPQERGPQKERARDLPVGEAGDDPGAGARSGGDVATAAAVGGTSQDHQASPASTQPASDAPSSHTERAAPVLPPGFESLTGGSGSGVARLVLGEGPQRLLLTVTISGQNVHVSGTSADGELVLDLHSGLEDLAHALARHGLSLGQFALATSDQRHPGHPGGSDVQPRPEGRRATDAETSQPNPKYRAGLRAIA